MKENLFEYLYVFFNSDEDVMGYIIHIFRPMTIKLIHSSVYKDLSCDFLRNDISQSQILSYMSAFYNVEPINIVHFLLSIVLL